MKNKQIFVKNTDNCKLSTILNKNDVLDIIPSKCSKYPIDCNLTEWRWRFYSIPFGAQKAEFVEISKKDKNQTRLFANANGDYVSYDISNKWDKYIVDEKYYYQ